MQPTWHYNQAEAHAASISIVRMYMHMGPIVSQGLPYLRNANAHKSQCKCSRNELGCDLVINSCSIHRSRACYSPCMRELLDIDAQDLQLLPHTLCLLLIGHVVLGTMLGREAWELCVPGCLVPRVREHCLQTMSKSLLSPNSSTLQYAHKHQQYRLQMKMQDAQP